MNLRSFRPHASDEKARGIHFTHHLPLGPGASGGETDTIEVTRNGPLSIQKRLAIRNELLNAESNPDSSLQFSNYDGGDGPDGDVLSFLEDTLP